MTFRSPYSHITDEDAMSKVQFNISKADKNFLCSLVPEHGFITAVGSSFFKSLADDFRREGIYYYDPSIPDFESRVAAVIQRRIGILPTGYADPVPATQDDLPTGPRNEPATTRGGNSPLSGATVQPASPAPATGVGRRSGRGSTQTSPVKGQVGRAKSTGVGK